MTIQFVSLWLIKRLFCEGPFDLCNSLHTLDIYSPDWSTVSKDFFYPVNCHYFLLFLVSCNPPLFISGVISCPTEVLRLEQEQLFIYLFQFLWSNISVLLSDFWGHCLNPFKKLSFWTPCDSLEAGFFGMTGSPNIYFKETESGKEIFAKKEMKRKKENITVVRSIIEWY